MSFKHLLPQSLSKDVLPIIGIFGIVAAVIFSNYQPGTWFWGWDNLVPEINPGLTLMRQISGFWQEYQGLGNIGGHGYMAALPHTLFVAALKLFLPASLIRYIFTFLMYWAGGLGSYFLIKYILTNLKVKDDLVRPSAFLGSLYYLLSLGTVFTFYVQLEPFIVMYGIFPLVLFELFSLLDNWDKKKLVKFFFLNLALSVIGFIPPVFITYAVFVGVILLWYISRYFTIKKLQRAFLTGLIVIAANMYWLLPLVYYSVSESGVYLNSKLNQVSTEDFIQKNKAYGDITNVPLLKGFFFESLNLQELNRTEQTESIAQPWIDHLKNPLVTTIGYASFIVILIGFIKAIITRTRSQVKSIYVLFLTTITGLAMSIIPFSFISSFIEWIPFLNQAFRSPYNKISMSASLFFAVLFGLGIAWLIQKLQSFTLSFKSVKIGIVLITTAILLLFSWPTFTGNFLYKENRIEVPTEYSDLFSYLNTQPSQARIMTFPLQSYNGWVTYDWGYTGSGFLWYGIKQPLMDRAFDVWNASNETFYNEASRAFYQNNLQLFSNVLQKYDISYVLIDKHVTSWGEESNLNFEEAQSMLEEIGAKEIWSKGGLSLYQISSHRSFVGTPTEVTPISSTSLYSSYDPVLNSGNNYIQVEPENSSISYPLSQISKVPLSSALIPEFSNSYLKFYLDGASNFDQLNIPEPNQGDYYGLSAKVEYKNNRVTITYLPPVIVTLDQKEIPFPTLSPSKIDIPDGYSKIAILLNGQIIEISKDNSKTVFLQSLRFQQPISVNIFSDNDANWKNGRFEITGSPIAEHIMTGDIWQPLSESFQVNTNHQTISLKIAAESQEYLPNLQSAQYSSNCDIFDRGKTDKKLTEDSVQYLAKNYGIFCESIFLTGTTTRTPSFVQISGQNNSGKGLKVEVSATNKSFGGFEAVTKQGNFSEFFPLLSSDSKEVSGYALSLETKSYGNQKGDSTINSIKVFPIAFSFEQLSKFNLRNTKNETDISSLEIKSNKWSNFFYRVEVSNAKESGLLTLSQAYSPGWIAFSRINFLSPLQHFIYDDWANAWIVPKGNHIIIIVFWPQLLNTIGFFTTLYITYKMIRSLRSNQ